MSNQYTIQIKSEEQVEKEISSFIARHPELEQGAVVTKIDVTGSQGKRRKAEIRSVYGDKDITSQASVGKADIQWIDIKGLSFKSTVNTQISTLMSRLAIRHSGMWIVPVSRLKEFYLGAQEIAERFRDGVRNVLDNYDLYVENEKKRSPLVADLIDKAKLSRSDFEKTFRFEIAHPLPFYPIPVEDNINAVDRYTEELVNDIATEAEFIYSSMENKNRINSTTITRLCNMQDKILSFTFLAPDCVKIAESFRLVLNTLPKGAINLEHDLYLLQQWLLLMSDTSKLVRIMNGDPLVEEMLAKLEGKIEVNHFISDTTDVNDPFTSINCPIINDSDIDNDEDDSSELVENPNLSVSGW